MLPDVTYTSNKEISSGSRIDIFFLNWNSWTRQLENNSWDSKTIQGKPCVLILEYAGWRQSFDIKLPVLFPSYSDLLIRLILLKIPCLPLPYSAQTCLFWDTAANKFAALRLQLISISPIHSSTKEFWTEATCTSPNDDLILTIGSVNYLTSNFF